MSVLHCVSVFYFFLLLNNFPLCVCATFVYSFISLGHCMLYLTWVVCQNGAEGHALGLSLALASLQTLHGSRSIFLFYKHCVKLERIVVLTLCSLSWLHRRQVGYCCRFICISEHWWWAANSLVIFHVLFVIFLSTLEKWLLISFPIFI